MVCSVLNIKCMAFINYVQEHLKNSVTLWSMEKIPLTVYFNNVTLYQTH